MSTGVIFILGKGGSPILASGVKSTWPQGSSAPGFSSYVLSWLHDANIISTLAYRLCQTFRPDYESG